MYILSIRIKYMILFNFFKKMVKKVPLSKKNLHENLGRMSSSQTQNWAFLVWMRRGYDWVARWAETPYSLVALFLISFAESSFFPIPPDVLLIAMGVGAPRRTLLFASVCLAGSLLGGLFGYAVGFGLWGMFSDVFFQYIPGFTPVLFDRAVTLFNDGAFWTIVTVGFTPIPYKIVTIASGVSQVPLMTFLLASLLGRGARFFLVGGALFLFGPSMKVWIEKYFDRLTILFTVLLIGGFVLVKYVF